MAAMTIPCNGILLIQGNLPKVILVFTVNNACFPIPYFKKKQFLTNDFHMINFFTFITLPFTAMISLFVNVGSCHVKSSTGKKQTLKADFR